MAKKELLLLKAYGSGYRGCVIEDDRYLFFQCSRKKGLKRLKSYPREEFTDTAQFMAMMQKFVTPPAFLQPTVTVDALTMASLDRIYRQLNPTVA